MIRSSLSRSLTAVISLLLMALSAGAQGLKLGVGTEQSIYYPGDQLQLSVSAVNAGVAGAADFYAGLILPDGVTVATVGADGTPRLGNLSSPAAFAPVASGVSLGGPFSVAVDPLLRYAWQGTEPIGTYTIFLAAVRAGGFADNRIDGGDILALETGTLSLRQPAHIAVDNSRAVSVPIAASGGTVSVTNAAGLSASLALPADAVSSETTITAAPVLDAAGLPLTRIIGAVQYGPDGLKLREPATFTVTLPPGLAPAGLIGFVSNDDGTGFETTPVTIASGTASIQVSHFSTVGIGQAVCGPGVTSAVGLAACRTMNQNLTEAAAIIEELAGTPLPVRVLLASEIIGQLRVWLVQFIEPSVREASNAANTDPTVQYFLMVALRERMAIEAILQMTEMLDPSSGLENELAAVAQLVPSAIDARRAVANAQCLQDKANFLTHLGRIRELSNFAESLGLPVNPDRGVTCLIVSFDISYPPVVPDAGAPFTATARTRFSDGVLVSEPPVISVELFERGFAVLGPATFAQGAGSATLTTTVAPRLDRGVGPRFEVHGEVAELGLFNVAVVDRPHRIAITSRTVTAAKQLRAGTENVNLSFTFPGGGAFVTAQTISSADPAGEAGVSLSEVTLTSSANDTVISGAGTLGNSASGDAESHVTLSSGLTAALTGNFDCRFDVVTTEFNIGATPRFIFRARRNGVAVFDTAATRTTTVACDQGSYQFELETGSDITPTGPGSASRTFSFTVTLTPRVSP
jgi:hypothetical protein